ncbi:hypothetical protein CR194_17555 [Salipaludibacillus keqinensis]|uniref:Uncharacterized protein n=1 Tax=Salipaludibacillus keqinensis TaxID=2045207 RepID=A0A323T7Y3_9BACI|nr:hypothetical protein [Salipaludibacillus keqinensis]PYZ92002.1 hypothetical protein CR194_17555 [Salipaludibacillus keqinensis]
MGNSYININPYDNRLNVKIEGSFSRQDTREFFKEYNKEIHLIPVSEYDIEVDCTDLIIENDEQVPLLEKIYHTFNEDGFNKILFIVKKSSVSYQRSFIESIKKVHLPQFQLKEV